MWRFRRLHRAEGLGIKAIARRFGMARNTVRAALPFERSQGARSSMRSSRRILDLLRELGTSSYSSERKLMDLIVAGERITAAAASASPRCSADGRQYKASLKPQSYEQGSPITRFTVELQEVEEIRASRGVIDGSLFLVPNRWQPRVGGESEWCWGV